MIDLKNVQKYIKKVKISQNAFKKKRRVCKKSQFFEWMVRQIGFGAAIILNDEKERRLIGLLLLQVRQLRLLQLNLCHHVSPNCKFYIG
jgi:hypothetical protein